MSEPTPAKPHPYAEIIDLFRDAGHQPAVPASAPAAAPAAPAPRVSTGAPSASATALESGRTRRAVMLLPVALLAVAGGAAAAVIHYHDIASTNAANPASTAPTTSGTSGAPGTAAPVQQVPAAAAQEYSRALDRLSAATDPVDLAAAARRSTAHTGALHSAKSALARAEAGHLTALVALGTLDSSTPGGLVSYAHLTAAAQRASDAVTTAAHGRTDVPDPSVATGHVVALAGSAVADGLGSQVGRLADAAAAAHLTAQLRIVAADAQALVPAAAGAASAVTDPGMASKATVYVQALRALAALQVIDGDHLTSWAGLQAPLQQSLVTAGVADAGDDVHAIDAMVRAAQQKMDAWVAGAGSVPPGPTAPDAAQTQRAVRAAQAAAKAAAGFATDADALVDRYAQVLATLPQVAPGQQPSYELATRFHQTGRLFDGLSASVAALDTPAGMADARSALADLVARGRAAATAGEELALSASECDPARRVCVLGAMREWPGYRRAVGALGSPNAVRGTIATGVRKARADVAAAAAERATATGTAAETPPKPVV